MPLTKAERRAKLEKRIARIDESVGKHLDYIAHLREERASIVRSLKAMDRAARNPPKPPTRAVFDRAMWSEEPGAVDAAMASRHDDLPIPAPPKHHKPRPRQPAGDRAKTMAAVDKAVVEGRITAADAKRIRGAAK